MPLSEIHRQVAAVALLAAARHGFALGGGNALIAHGVIDRITQDVDLFTDEEHGVEAAAEAVEAALRAATPSPCGSPATRHRRLLGAQLFGHKHAEIAKRIDIAATAGSLTMS